MKFIVDELPDTPHQCPFYTSHRCMCGTVCNRYCERFDHDYCIIDRNVTECIMLKEIAHERKID
jgi:hypothetical protein